MYGIGLIGGIGFTMSLFIAALAFGESDLIINAKAGIMLGSVLSGIAGYLMLRKRKVKVKTEVTGEQQ